VGRELEGDEAVRVVVFQSANPELFIAHADVELAKGSVDAAELPTREDLLEEEHRFQRSLATEAAQERIAAFLAAGGQTRDIELDLDALVSALADAPEDSSCLVPLTSPALGPARYFKMGSRVRPSLPEARELVG
jgi:enoyl-CoA hydratase/carnithine racemase